MGTPPGLKGLQAYVTEHQQELYRLAYSYTRSREDALDAVQEAVLKAIDKISTLRDPERPDSGQRMPDPPAAAQARRSPGGLAGARRAGTGSG